MQIKKSNETNQLLIQHSEIISKIEKKIKEDKWEYILKELPPGSILVGGYIRDLIINRSNPFPDIDVVVPNNSLKVGRKISEKFSGKFLILDQERNIVRIIFREFIVDIANQTEEFLLEDLRKRDFTINSVSFSLGSRKLIDPVDGICDLSNSLLRSYNLNNLLNDPLRLLRCFRFVSELDFDIEPNLFKFIELQKSQLKTISVERIQYELKKIVNGQKALKTVLMLNKIKIFDWIQNYDNYSDKFLLSANFDYFLQEEVEKYIPIFYLRELLNREVIKTFKFSKLDTYRINSLRVWSNKLKNKSIENFTERERFDLHKDLEMILPAFILYLPLEYHYDWLKRWRNNQDKLFHPKNLINGNTLKNIIGIKDGPLLGNLLDYLSREFAYERLKDFDEAIYKAKDWFQQNAPKCD
tara:strand:- start:822 stop:2060 length:1239 start_codon:yes stop_codon:yes gene_type:complete